MDFEPVMQMVEIRTSYRYVQAHPWVVQAITGFLSAYFMEHPGFRVQRHLEELESGMHVWICEVPRAMQVLRLLKRLQADMPPYQIKEVTANMPILHYVIDSPETESSMS